MTPRGCSFLRGGARTVPPKASCPLLLLPTPVTSLPTPYAPAVWGNCSSCPCSHTAPHCQLSHSTPRPPLPCEHDPVSQAMPGPAHPRSSWGHGMSFSSTLSPPSRGQLGPQPGLWTWEITEGRVSGGHREQLASEATPWTRPVTKVLSVGPDRILGGLVSTGCGVYHCPPEIPQWSPEQPFWMCSPSEPHPLPHTPTTTHATPIHTPTTEHTDTYHVIHTCQMDTPHTHKYTPISKYIHDTHTAHVYTLTDTHLLPTPNTYTPYTTCHAHHADNTPASPFHSHHVHKT